MSFILVALAGARPAQRPGGIERRRAGQDFGGDSARTGDVGAPVSAQIASVARLEVAVGTDPQWLGSLVRVLTRARQ